MDKSNQRFNQIYNKKLPEDIPWNALDLPTAIKDLIEKNTINPCKTINIGCGLASYSRELAKMGFEITGVDFSDVAIEKANELATRQNLTIEFFVADFTQKLQLNLSEFNFAFDYSLLHHIFPEDRKRYIRNVNMLLNKNAFYLSITFNEEDDYFEGKGKYCKTPTKSVLYFSNTDEIQELCSPLFHILQLKNITIPGKNGNHRAYYALMQKNKS